MNRSSILVEGIGLKGMKYPSSIYKIELREYRIWKGMLRRCTTKCSDIHTSYIGTTCSENFKSYEYFYEWCQKQIGFNSIDTGGIRWHLDKDLLLKGNKHYSEDNCVFIPQRINKLLTKSNGTRGIYPLGVSYHKRIKMFSIGGHNGEKRVHLGYLHCQKEAFQVYKAFKESVIKQVAEEYKDQLDQRAYKALMEYQVEITD